MPRAKAPAKKRAPAKKAPAKKAPARGRGRAKKNLISVDFTDVDTGGGIPTPDGIYTAEVRSVEKEVSSAGNEMLVVRYKTNIGSTVYENFVLVPQSLWVLRTALDCMGYGTPDGEFEFDPDDLVGQELGLEITNEEYEERDRPRVTGHLPLDAAEAQAGGTPPAEDVPDDDEEEDVEDDEEEVADDDVEDDEGEDEEEEAPPPKTRAKKKAAPRKKGGALRAGNKVTFEDEGEDYAGVIEYIDDEGMATVLDDEDVEWEIPLDELTKA